MKITKFLTKDGKEVKIGNTITVDLHIGSKVVKTEMTLNEESLHHFIEGGVIRIVEEDNHQPVMKLTIDMILTKLAKKINLPESEMLKVVNLLSNLNHLSTINLILKTASTIMNHKYPTRFKDCTTVFAYDVVHNLPVPISLKEEENYKILRLCACFHSLDDLNEALKLVKPILECINGKQENH